MSPPHLGYQVVFDSQIYCRCAKSESDLYQATSGPIQWVWSHVWMGYDWGEPTCSSHLAPSHTCDEYCMITLVWQLVFFFRQMIWFDLIPSTSNMAQKRKRPQFWSPCLDCWQMKSSCESTSKGAAVALIAFHVTSGSSRSRVMCDVWQVEAWLGKHARQAGPCLKSAQSQCRSPIYSAVDATDFWVNLRT